MPPRRERERRSVLSEEAIDFSTLEPHIAALYQRLDREFPNQEEQRILQEEAVRLTRTSRVVEVDGEHKAQHEFYYTHEDSEAPELLDPRYGNKLLVYKLEEAEAHKRATLDLSGIAMPEEVTIDQETWKRVLVYVHAINPETDERLHRAMSPEMLHLDLDITQIEAKAAFEELQARGLVAKTYTPRVGYELGAYPSSNHFPVAPPSKSALTKRHVKHQAYEVPRRHMSETVGYLGRMAGKYSGVERQREQRQQVTELRAKQTTWDNQDADWHKNRSSQLRIVEQSALDSVKEPSVAASSPVSPVENQATVVLTETEGPSAGTSAVAATRDTSMTRSSGKPESSAEPRFDLQDELYRLVSGEFRRDGIDAPIDSLAVESVANFVRKRLRLDMEVRRKVSDGGQNLSDLEIERQAIILAMPIARQLYDELLLQGVIVPKTVQTSNGEKTFYPVKKTEEEIREIRRNYLESTAGGDISGDTV